MDEESDIAPAANSARTIVATSASQFSTQSSLTMSRSLAMHSTRLLFMNDSIRDGRSDQDVFYDCEDSPKEGRSARGDSPKRSGGARGPTEATSPSRCQMDNPSAIRDALERAANATQVLLKNFDKAGGWNAPTAVTLELTARLVDTKRARPLEGKPVTVQMPLQFNAQGGKISTCQQTKKLVARKARRAPACQCRTQSPMSSIPKTPNKPNKGKSASEQLIACDESLQGDRSRSAVFLGSCGDSSSRSFRCNTITCQHRYNPDAREVISVLYLPVPEPESEEEEPLEEEVVEEVVEKAVEEVVEEPVIEKNLVIPAAETETETETETESSSEESSDTYGEPQSKTIYAQKSESPPLEVEHKPQEAEDKPEPEKPTSPKKYFLALPQNKDFSNCSPCRFDPSPIMDEEGNVFCPGNCGCCMCPWMKRSLASNWEHVNVKVCRCVQRGTIFTKFEDREVCSQTSYFDFCPCREKAEAKFLELYNHEMWTRKDGIRGREITLSEIKELLVPVQPNE